jgi:hypothetical protein
MSFDPWCGDSYRTPPRNGGPLLLLGWSHYQRRAGWEATEPLDSNFTNKCIEDHIEKGYDTPKQFWAKVRQAVIGGECVVPREECREFWRSVAFYNYIQEALQDAKDRPSKEQHRKARAAFLAVLQTLMPKKIIVLGESLWRGLPNDGHSGHDLVSSEADQPIRKTWHYPTGLDGVAVASRIDHPSVRSKWHPDHWHRWVTAALNQDSSACLKCSAALTHSELTNG